MSGDLDALHDSFVVWATSLADPFAPTDVVGRVRQEVVGDVAADPHGLTAGAVAELLASCGAVIDRGDVWRQLPASGSADWWADFYPEGGYFPVARQLAPVPTREQVAVIRFALDQQVGSADTLPPFDIADIEAACKCLIARFRAEEPGIEVREFAFDVAEAAWSLAELRQPPKSSLAKGSLMDIAEIDENLLASLLTPDLLDPPVLRDAAAVGITNVLWRNTVIETAHASSGLGRITDGEMFAANVATTRMVRSHLRRDVIDWVSLSRDFADPNRLAGRRTVADLFGPLYQNWAIEGEQSILVQSDIATERGERWMLLSNACRAPRKWWGMPEWPAHVDRFLASLDAAPPAISAEELRRILLNAPDEAEPLLLSWCIHRGINYI